MNDFVDKRARMYRRVSARMMNQLSEADSEQYAMQDWHKRQQILRMATILEKYATKEERMDPEMVAAIARALVQVFGMFGVLMIIYFMWRRK